MDPQWKSTSKFILLPELKIITHWQSDKFRTRYKCAKESAFEVCLNAQQNPIQCTIDGGSVWKINRYVVAV